MTFQRETCRICGQAIPEDRIEAEPGTEYCSDFHVKRGKVLQELSEKAQTEAREENL